MDITGTTALVTGANRGLGRALVDALLERGRCASTPPPTTRAPSAPTNGWLRTRSTSPTPSPSRTSPPR